MNKSLKSNFVFNLINQILNFILPLITAPYVARVFGAVGTGQYSYAFSIAQYFVIFASLGFSVYGQREIAKNSGNKFKQSVLFWEIFLARLIPSIFSICLYLILGFNNLIGVYDKLLMFSLSINILAVIFDLSYLFLGLEEFKLIALRTIIVKVVGAILIFTLINSADDVWLYGLCLSLSSIGSYLLMRLRLSKYVTFVPLKELNLTKHIKPVLLLFLPNIAVTIYTILDKTMINLLTPGTQEFKDYSNGCYEQAYKINSISLIFVTVISPVFQSRNSSLFANSQEDKLKKNVDFAIDYVWRVSLPLFFGFLVLSSNLTSWFYGDGYDDVPILMIIMALRFIFSGFYEVFGTQVLLVYGQEKFIFIATWSAAIVNFLLNLCLIPFLGAVGAAISTAVCEFVNFIIVFLVALKKGLFSGKRFFLSFVKPLFSSLIMFFVVFPIQYFWESSIISFIVIAIIGVFVYCISMLIFKDSMALFSINKFFELFKKLPNSLRRK